MATSLTLQNDASLAQGYVKVNGTTSATFTTSGITGNLVGNVTGNVTGNADTATKLSTATGSAPSYACRAWVNFDGTRDTTGAVSTANTNRLIRASGNVASVLRNGLGDYTVTFTTAMSDANYTFFGCGRNDADGTAGYPPCISQWLSDTQSTTQLQIRGTNGNNNLEDFPTLCVSIFGN
jgi:hypothetical protein